MTDQEALLRAVVDDPENDTPRLVYADWLDENGQPERAELIRGQCHLARTNGEPESHERIALADRIGRLVREYAPAWRKELPHGAGVGWGPFRRGMVEAAVFRVTTHPTKGPPATFPVCAFDLTPLRILRVNFPTTHPDVRAAAAAKLLGWPELRRFRVLVVEFGYFDGWANSWDAMVRALCDHDWSLGPAVLGLRASSLRGNVPWGVFADVPPDKVMPALDLRSAEARPEVRAALVRRYGDGVRF